VKPRSNPKPAVKSTEKERQCWLYFYNYVSRDKQTRRYKGEKEDWKQTISKQLGKDFALLTGCRRVAAPPGEQRLVLECPTKSSRRQLYAGIRRSKGDIRCNISLTKLEYENKQIVYRSAAHRRLQAVDRGDMMILTNPRGTGLVNEVRIWLDRPTA
jgi:hypothetical protein